MSKRKDTVHIFHLYRKDGTAVFLHPFRNSDKLFQVLEKAEIAGHYGTEPRVESLTLFRNELYRLVETRVKRWVADSRFIPRFILSAGIFLVSYLFLSFVVRDPLPILDEVAISLAVAIGANVLLGRRDLKSEAALKKRIALRSKVDAIVFTESEFVRRLETALIAKEDEKPEELLEQIVAGNTALLAEDHEQEAEQIVRYLDAMFESSDFKRTQKRLRRMEGSVPGRERDSMQRWLESKKVDVPLLVLYMQLKKEVKTRA
ncbi:MAG: hypothetical protein KAU31_17150 [Spirochaetaceae bacterium]|nr:hypothetical protein [Spirochaetaceae bacterium]